MACFTAQYVRYVVLELSVAFLAENEICCFAGVFQQYVKEADGYGCLLV